MNRVLSTLLTLAIVLLSYNRDASAQDTRTYNGPAPMVIPLNKTISTPGFTAPEYTDYADGIATMTFSEANRNIRGTPFMNEEFMFGTLTLVDSIVVEGQKYRYNIYADEMQFILKGDTASIFQPMKVNSIEFGERKFIYDLRMTGQDKMEAGYFEVLEEGNASLLLHRVARLDVDEYVSTYMGGGGSGDLFYKHSRFYYLKIDEFAARKIRNNREVIKLLPDRKSELKQFIKEEKIRFKKEEDLKRLINYYNSIS